MINSLTLLRNIGRFDSVTNASNFPLAKLTLLYAENGRGKTTLAAVLRSLSTVNPIPIIERRRLAAQHPPHAVVSCIGGPPDAMFQNGAWNRTLPDLVIFDDMFVDENIYSGLVVDSDHRQNLHELILGSQGVALNQQLQVLIARIEQHNAELRDRGNAIPADERGGLSVDAFCALEQNQNIDQEIQTTEQDLAASRQQDPIRNTPNFQSINLPAIDLAEIEKVLGSSLSDLDTAAAERVQSHLQSLSEGSEQWVADGMRRQDALSDTGGNHCVFCAQDLTGSPVITHYRAFFSDAYRSHQQGIRDTNSNFMQVHSENAAVLFERPVGAIAERRRFWSDFGAIPEVAIDSAAIIAEWNSVRTEIASLLEQKMQAPLDAIDIPEQVRSAVDAYEMRRNEIAVVNQQLTAANQTITDIKQRATTANQATLSSTLASLKSTKARHTPGTAALCATYLAEKQAKALTEQQRDQARQALEQYRTQVFPAYEAAINRYLQKFNAGYHLDSLAVTNTRGGPACNYNVVVNNTAINVGGGDPQTGEHSFKNILSAGDRNTLAIA